MTKNTIREVKVQKKRHINLSRTVPEVFDVVTEAPSQDEKVALLKAYDTKALRFIVNGMYNVDWSGLKIPKVKFNHRPPEISGSNINTVITRINAAYKYRESQPDKSNKLMIRVLEDVSQREAELIIDMIRGKKIQGISKSVFKQAFPEFFRMETQKGSA